MHIDVGRHVELLGNDHYCRTGANLNDLAATIMEKGFGTIRSASPAKEAPADR